jgi:chorismate synthase
MNASVFGEAFKIMSFGESHGKAVGVVIDGVKPGLPISRAEIQRELDRRKPGQSRVGTARREGDRVHILSGVFDGKTLGTPVCLVVYNRDARPGEYERIRGLFRPGQADYTYFRKFGIRDYRGGGRASGRETVARVAAGAIAKKLLEESRVKIVAYTIEAAGIRAERFVEREIERNPMRCPDRRAAAKMERAVLEAKKAGNSVGGIVEIVAKNVPAGLGEPVFGKLDAELAKALVSIGSVKGVEFGAGFSAARMTGRECNDEMYSARGKILFKSNNAGGILGGISTGQDIVARIAVKPTPSIAIEQSTVDEKGQNRRISVGGRHDACICPRIAPVAEAMVALVLADAMLLQNARRK